MGAILLCYALLGGLPLSNDTKMICCSRGGRNKEQALGLALLLAQNQMGVLACSCWFPWMPGDPGELG